MLDEDLLDREFLSDDLTELEENAPDKSAFEAALTLTRRGNIDLKRGDWYPEILRAELTLRKLIAAAYSLPEINVQVHHGSNGSIDGLLTFQALRATRRPPRLVLMDPTYFRVYASAKARDYELTLVPSLVDFQLDVPSMRRAIEERQPDVVYLCSPNNPTGIPIEDKDLDQLVARCPTRCLVILDRTLADVAPHTATPDLLARHANSNFVILHSFSKFCGLSQYRVGVMLFASEQLASEHKPFGPLGVNLEGCIRASREVRRAGAIEPSASVIAAIRNAMDQLAGNLGGLTVTSSSGNYALLYDPDSTRMQRLSERLARAKVSVMLGKQFPNPREDCIRIVTAAAAASIAALIRELRAVD